MGVPRSDYLVLKRKLERAEASLRCKTQAHGVLQKIITDQGNTAKERDDRILSLEIALEEANEQIISLESPKTSGNPFKTSGNPFELTQLRKENDHLNAELSRIRTEHRKYCSKLIELQESTRVQRVNSLERQFSELTKDRDRAVTELLELKTENRELKRAKKAPVLKSPKTAPSELKNLQTRLEEEKQRSLKYKELQTELEKERAKNGELECSISKERAKNGELEQERAMAISASFAKNRELQGIILKLRKELHDVKDPKAELHEIYKTVEDVTKRMKDFKERTPIKWITDTGSLCSKLMEANKDLLTKLQNASGNEGRIEDLQKVIMATRADLEKKCAKNGALEGTIRKLQHDLEQVNMAVRTNLKKDCALNGEMADKIRDLKTDLEKERALSGQLADTIRKMKKNENPELEKELKKERAINGELADTVELLSDTIKKMTKELKQKNENPELQKQLDRERAINGELADTIRKLTKETKKNENPELQKQLDKERAINGELADTIRKLTKEKKKANQDGRKQLEKERAINGELADTIQKLKKEAQLRKCLEEQKTELHKQYSMTTKLNTSLDGAKKKLRDEKLASKRLQEELERTKLELKKHLKKSKARASSSENQLRKELELMKLELAEAKLASKKKGGAASSGKQSPEAQALRKCMDQQKEALDKQYKRCTELERKLAAAEKDLKEAKKELKNNGPPRKKARSSPPAGRPKLK